MNYSPATFLERFAALSLSLIIYLLGVAIAVTTISNIGSYGIELYSYAFLVLCGKIFLIILICDNLLQAFGGANLAKLLLGLRLVQDHNHRPLGFIRSILRSILALASVALLGLGFIALAFNSKRKTLYDLITDCIVISPKEKNIFRQSISVISSILGLGIIITLLFSLVSVPTEIFKSLYNANELSTFSSAAFKDNPQVTLNIPITAGRITAMSEDQSAEFVELTIDSSSIENYISEATIKRLQLNKDNFSFRLKDKKLEKVVYLPKLILKDKEQKDIAVYRQRFTINQSLDQLGKPFLELFDYSLDKEELALKLQADEQAIYGREGLDEVSLNYLIAITRRLQQEWTSYLNNLPVAQIAAFNEVKTKPSNHIEVEIDTSTGYIKHIILTEPSKDREFNEICKKFLQNTSKITGIPSVLKETPVIMIELTLSYSNIE